MQRLRVLAPLMLACGANLAWAQVVFKTEALAKLVHQTFGPLVQLASDGREARFPRYLQASLNYDDADDLVIPLYVDKARGTLDARGIKPISIVGQRSVDASIGEHCLGLAFLHGSSGARPFKPAATYMTYECFSGFTKVRAGAQLLSNAHVPGHNDAVLIDLESGGQMLIYWNSGEYAAKYVRQGD